jgi:RNA polymerase sigma-70 factor (ECF subfamily)
MEGKQSDFELLRAWSHGDTSAGNELIDRHGRMLLRFFRRKLDDHSEDLTQKTFATCLELHERLRPDASFRAFALGVARNILLQHRRATMRDQERVRHAPDPEPVTTPSQIATLRQEQRLLLKALRTLRLDLQIVIELHYWEELKVDEIAEVLEAPAGTVKWRLSRARKLLHARILEGNPTGEIERSTVTNFERWARSLRDEAGLNVTDNA